MEGGAKSGPGTSQVWTRTDPGRAWSDTDHEGGDRPGVLPKEQEDRRRRSGRRWGCPNTKRGTWSSISAVKRR